MDTQEFFDMLSTSFRKKEIDSDNRLLLGEIILKLEAVTNKDLPLIFDIPNHKPMGMGSWRGIYDELAIYTNSIGSIQTGKFKTKKYGESTYQIPEYNELGKIDPTVSEWIQVMKQCIGGTFTGYKGGDFTMNKNTPVNVTQEVSYMGIDEYAEVYILDVKELKDSVVFITGHKDHV